MNSGGEIMLVQFSIKNVLSFKEETVFDMTAISAYKEHMSNLINIGNKDKFLKVAAIYGANASGKSNLYFAMLYFQDIIIRSMNNYEEGQANAIEEFYCPFSFEKNMENSEFQIVIILEGFEYRYGFEYNNKTIVAEWLYRVSLKTNRTTTIFERTEEEVLFGASVRSECAAFKNQIPSETLALSFFSKLSKLGTEVFKKVYEGIMDILIVPMNFEEDRRVLRDFLPSIIDNNKTKLLEFLAAIDTGIKDIKYEDTENEIRFITFHVGRHGEKYPLNLYNESEGTIKSVILFIFAKIALLYDKSIFVDELNIKLHPLLLKFIIDLFYEEESQAQLIYTTHDTTLLDKKFFRRDQIWFVQKDEFGYSKLSALSDYKVRSDASFEKDYLAGVYGGIPFLNNDFRVKEGD